MRVSVKEDKSEDLMYNGLHITINGSYKFSVSSSEDSPEDNSLHRSFSDCYDIPSMLRKAFEAGKNGEDFELFYEEGDEK